MKNVTKKAVQKLVKENNIIGVVRMSFDNGINTILSDGGKLEFENGTIASKVFRMLKFELSFNVPTNFFDQDEFDGLCQANKLGVNPYECTVMS